MSAVNVNLPAILITAILLAVMLGYKHLAKKKLSPIILISISAVVGIIIYGI